MNLLLSLSVFFREAACTEMAFLERILSAAPVGEKKRRIEPGEGAIKI